MGIKERQDREREATRAAILTAARELFVAEGYRNVSMRKIAERIEYSPAAIYSYFSNKDAIFFALFEEGFRLMGEANTAATAAASDPLQRVRAMFLEYYRFSRAHPQFFELMFLDRSVPQISEQWDGFAFLNERMSGAIGLVQEAIDAGGFPPGSDAAVVFHVLWGAIHGPAAIALCTRHGPSEDPDALALDVLDATIAGLRTGITARFVPDICHRQALPARSAAETTHASS